MPLRDLKPHKMDSHCWCHPKLEADVWVHNSLDHREAYERGELRLN